MTAPLLTAEPAFVRDPAQRIVWAIDGFGLSHFDTAGCRWIRQRSRGWNGPSKPRTARTPRADASGSFRGRAYQDEKIITLKGVCKARTPALRADAEARLGSICPDGDRLYELMRTGEDGITQYRYVELDDAIDPVPLGDLWFEWDLQFAAPDSRKYGDWISTSTPVAVEGVGGVDASGPGVDASGPGLAAGTPGRLADITATNVGTAAMGPLLQIAVADPTTRFTVANPDTGDQTVYDGAPIEPGHDLWINCDEHPQTPPGWDRALPGHAVLLDGVASRRHDVAIWGAWLAVRPRAVTRLLLTGFPGAPPVLTAHYRAAWR